MTDLPDWTDETVLMAEDPDGDLVFVQADSYGRLKEVVTDPEDVWGRPHYLGLAELAARLGSLVTFDRRGDVIWIDNFEDNISKWWGRAPSGGSSLALSSERARSGGLSAKLTTGAIGGDGYLMGRRLPLPRDTRIGFELSFSLEDSNEWLYWDITIYDGSTSYRGHIQYNYASQIIQYESAWGVYTTLIDGIRLYELVELFHTGKLVIDWSTKKYVRFLINEREVDMSTYSLPSSASIVSPNALFDIGVYTLQAAAKSMWVDDVIITQNEP